MLCQRRLRGDSHYKQLDGDSVLGFRVAHMMVEEYMVQFNSQVAKFLVDSEGTKGVTPLRVQCEPSFGWLRALSQDHEDWVPLSLHLCHHRLGSFSSYISPDLQFHVLVSV
ncbi:Helicase with zinc finger domain 2 [Camelus dromedarius]|uniref:Helicase with zinc finger domain 2 n=2 Tax=Camelus dromedarius TaxID=9838 RepID=A0A5N4CU55_CAMDR|nr:Helicase with zinc finger domain 2 [Camelus dromedarius]